MRLLSAPLLLACAAAPGHSQDIASNPVPVQQAANAVTFEQYQAHLEHLRTVVASCSRQLDASTCDPAQVGPDDEVSLGGGPRRVSYTWLRSTLNAAAHPASPGKENGPKSDLPALLQAADARLAEDANATSSPLSSAPVQDASRNLAAILQQREFQHLHTDNTWLDKAKQAFWQWIFTRIAGLASIGGKTRWLGELLLWAIVVLPCALLLRWAFLQSRRSAANLTPAARPDPASPSAREWQVWIAEAEQFAAQQRWREAVHHVYWAAISRMEARGLWPADRARTPREYLCLLPADNSLLPDLRALTGDFERIWYGHREAQEREYQNARSLMDRLAPK